MSQPIYFVIHRDHSSSSHDLDYTTKSSPVISIHSSLPAANRAAEVFVREHTQYLANEHDQIELEEGETAQGHYHCAAYLAGEVNLFLEIAVEQHIMGPATGPTPPKMGRYGLPMYTLPSGKPNGLRGAKFCFTGRLTSMDRPTAHAAVLLHGGVVVAASQDADYLVAYSGISQKDMSIIMENQLVVTDEKGFYKLLKNGVPESRVLKNAESTLDEEVELESIDSEQTEVSEDCQDAMDMMEGEDEDEDE